MPSLAIEELSHRPLPSPSRSHRAVPSPSRSCCAVHCRQGAVAPYLAINEPSAVSTDDSGHLSHPSQASRSNGCCIASPHSAAFHLTAPLIGALPFVPLVHLAGCHVS